MAGDGFEESSGGEARRGDEMVLPTYFYEVPETGNDGDRPVWIVHFIVIVNLVVFMAVMFVNNCPDHVGAVRGCCVSGFLGRFSFQPLRENPLLGPSSSTLKRFGALKWDKIAHQHQWWRLLASIWLHAGVFHLLADSLCLLFIGIRLEKQFGSVRIATIYIISGIGGNILSTIYITKGISVGASGALFGLFGAMLSELFTNWTIYSNRGAAFTTLLLIAVLNMVIGIFPLVNNFAHMGGFVVGFLLGFVLLIRPQLGWVERQHLNCHDSSKFKPYQLVLWGMANIFLLLGFGAGLMMLFRGVNGSEWCHWCRYMNCVPTSKWSCGN